MPMLPRQLLLSLPLLPPPRRPPTSLPSRRVCNPFDGAVAVRVCNPPDVLLATTSAGAPRRGHDRRGGGRDGGLGLGAARQDARPQPPAADQGGRACVELPHVAPVDWLCAVEHRALAPGAVRGSGRGGRRRGRLRRASARQLPSHAGVGAMRWLLPACLCLPACLPARGPEAAAWPP
eukprot:356905-Chlamydomonas_euryale.AAC.4